MIKCTPLAVDTAHVWRIDLEPDVGAGFPERLIPENHLLAREILSDEEFAKASRFVTQPLRLRYAAAHVALRFILGSYLGVDPHDVVLSVEKMGRPIVDFSAMGIDRKLHFNLSHSNNVALVAVSLMHPIGVDVEHVRPMDSRSGIQRQVYTEIECQRLQGASDARWFDYWTAKEAVLKVTGYGFYLNPLHVHLDADLSVAHAMEASGRSQWHLHCLALQGPWSATIATSVPMQQIIEYPFFWQEVVQ